MGRRKTQKPDEEIMGALVTTGPTVPSDHEMMVYRTMAEHAVSSKMYKNIGEKAGVMMIMLAARELGIPCMQALNGGLNIINGKVEISARMMSALIRKAGHQINVKECTDTHCLLVGKRSDTGETQTSSFSVAEAQKAGLIKPGGGWVKFPKDMCFARALSRLARQLFSDVIGMGYVEGEIGQQEVKHQIEHVEEEAQQAEEPVAEIVYRDPSDNLQKLLQRFEEKDHADVRIYTDVVKNHFAWTEEDTVQRFLNEPNIVEKFNNWKKTNQGKTE
jgi:hypothetical protein